MVGDFDLVNHEQVATIVVIDDTRSKAIGNKLATGSFQEFQVIGVIHYTHAISVFVIN
jgi:hypothetical protein